jgi:prevent-host-death family protein
MKGRKKVSISAARENLPTLVRDVERGLTVTLTRRGEPVAVLLSTERYRTHTKGAISLSRALQEFRNAVDLDELDIDSVYLDVRDRSAGRSVDL